MDSVIRAAKIANIHDFIMKELPDKYNTIVGEKGVRLSGGQRQRIGIARALYHDPAVLVLDEATANVDPDTEHLVQNALWKIMGGRTSIIIAHRLATLKKIEKILVVHKGRIVEEGTHQDLIKKGGIYSTLYKLQEIK